ncbi:MAG: periplasmic heavy metal sensor [Chloracidobacterium sp.]|nr:periplasmic heavy metal sensor [Chloracidobacterium sp.]MDW8218056.1 periplasmic heavy metal sensor [Acidobacteriota bacterium]
MPQRLRLGVFGGFLLYGVLVGTAVAQQPSPPPPPDDPDAALLRQETALPAALYESRLLARALGLTPDQVRRMQEVRRQEGPAMQAARRKVVACRRLLNDAIYGEETSDALVDQRARELAAAEAELTQLRARMQYRIRAVLTVEQLRTLNELRAEPREDFLRRRPERPGRPIRRPTP